jgi:hypothetical protein
MKSFQAPGIHYIPDWEPWDTEDGGRKGVIVTVAGVGDGSPRRRASILVF